MGFPFETIAREFQLIETALRPVIVPYATSDTCGYETAKRLLDKLEWVDRAAGIARDLQPYVVQVPPSARNALLAAGAATAVQERRFADQFVVLKNTDLYRPDVGLTWDDPTFRHAEELVW